MLTQLQGFDEVMGFGKGYVIWMFSLFLVRSCHFSWMSCFQTVVLQVKIFFQFVYIMFCNAKITLQNTSDPHPSNPWSGPNPLRGMENWARQTSVLISDIHWVSRMKLRWGKVEGNHQLEVAETTAFRTFSETSFFWWKSLWFKACDGHSNPFFLVDRLNFNNRTRKQGMDMAILSCQIMWNPRSVSRECMNQYLPICAANYLLIPFWEGESWNTASNKPQFLDGWEVKTTRDE